MKKLLIFTLICWTTNLSAQNDSSSISLGAYVDGYYSWYSNAYDVAVQQHDCIGAFHNNFGLNVAQVSAAYTGDRLRGIATVHFGDIPAITWANNYRNIQEANAGVRLANRLWLDVGFFKTHVGAESFLPKDNLMSIISLGTFYGPFYQGGARLTYETESGWHFEGHAINGYNLHIDNNDYKTFGALVSKEFGEKLLISYSAMAGQERVGQLNDGYLLYQNIYANLSFERWDIQLATDVATANDWKIRSSWYEPLIVGIATVKYHFNERFAVAVRGEMFSDESSINSFRQIPVVNSNAIPSQSSNAQVVGMTVYGGTVSVEYKPTEGGFLRLESRTLYDPNAFSTDYPAGFRPRQAGGNPMLVSRTQVMLTAGFYFDKSLTFAR